MAFCTSCGKNIPANSPFCEHCGARQELPVSVGAKAPSPPPPAPDAAVGFIGAAEPSGSIPAQPRPPRKPMSKGMRAGLIAAGSVAALLFLFVFITGQLFTPEKTAAQFLEALRAGDYAAFSKVVTPKTDALELTEESVAPLFLLYSDDTSRMSNLQDALSEDIVTLKTGITAKGNGFVRLIVHDHVLFKTYSVELTGATVHVSSPLPNTQVNLGAATMTTAEVFQSVPLSNILPGRYNFKATAKSALDGSSFTTSDTVTVFPGFENHLELYFESCQLSIGEPDLPVSAIFINDAAYTGEIVFDEYGELSLSPSTPRIPFV